MKQKLPFLLMFLLAFTWYGKANNDKYRLILFDNPATTITVAWNQISGNNATVYYGTEDFGTNSESYPFSKTVDHSTTAKGMNNQFSRLTNLSPNTIYFFVIADSEGVSKRFWFKTAPADDSRLFFIAGGDSRNNREPRQNANKLVSKLKPHAVFFGGDMTDDDTNTEWQEWFDDWQLTTAEDGRMFPIVPARGNHESASSVYELFDTRNENSYYAITWGNDLIRTYTLNTEISVLGDQLTWLKTDLSNSEHLTWKMAQYHKPMRPHTSGKSEGNNEYNAWAHLFYEQNIRLVVDSDSHTAKTTWPVRPSSAPGNDEGFVVDEEKGTVYTGEGCWGAPLRPNNDDKSWTRNSGSFNQFKVIFINKQKIELRTINVNNANDVTEMASANTNPFILPENLNVFSPETGSIVEISNTVDNPCPIVGTACDDGNPDTVNDEEDGFCNCVGLLNTELEEKSIPVASGQDDAEEDISTGTVTLESSTLELINNGADQVVGIRFNNVNIPEGATLYRAYIQFETAENSQVNPTNLTIHGELSAASTAFMSSEQDISSRLLTENSKVWNDITPWETPEESGIYQRTPYVTDIVSEIVSQTEWTLGNAITFMFSGSGKRVAGSFEGHAAPVLKLFYQIPCNPAGTVCDDGDPTTTIDLEDGNCNCIGIKDEDTLTFQVNTGSDDAEQAETGGAMYSDSSDLELVYDSFADQFNQTVGVRFNNILVPKGATILNARIQFTVDETSSDATNLVIHGEKVNNSMTFAETANNITNRTQTTATVNWFNVPAWNTVGESGNDQETPNLKSIVQEIVDQDDWQPYNSMSFFITGEGRRTAEAFDGSAEGAPKLVVTYSILGNTCDVAGTPCDDGDDSTINDEQDGSCNCAGIPSNSTEQENLVLLSNDDAEENLETGEVDLTSSDLELIYDGANQVVGIRFNEVQFPEGSTLYRAYIQFETDEDDMEEDPTNLLIHGELTATSSEFNSDKNNISSRTLTSSSVAWNSIPVWDTVGEAGVNQRTPYVTDIVREIMSQTEWTSGNAITFMFSGSGKRVAEAKDGSAAPVLKLFYISPCNPLGTTCDDGNPNTSFDVEDGNCNCVGIENSGMLTYQVNHSNNDAEEEVSTGIMDITSSDLELIAESGDTDQYVGIRFEGIQLPANAKISNAYIQFTTDDDNDNVTNLEIRAEAVANSAMFTSENKNISSRTLGNEVVQWTEIPEWTSEDIGNADEKQRTPNLAPLVQEVLSQTGWELLNAMTFIFSGSGEREAEAFDGTAAPQLIITYTINNGLTVEDNVLENAFKVYPNPVKNVLNVTSKLNISKLNVYDISGKLILNKQIGVKTLKHQIDVSRFQNGMYFIEVFTNTTKQTIKFIKK
ncbi:T9SS type A sorting domain-containing protein [Formosa haliotis]|uniref:T9SS type A sorting domain-containing protein n=1 Tax=Formosa haliotis TaxID=1555194 RepID=UPI0008264666|nr:T9SS type A sorting domain-containing protein [Formosa haliotis]